MNYHRENLPGDWIINLGAVAGGFSTLRLPADFPESLVKALDDAVTEWRKEHGQKVPLTVFNVGKVPEDQIMPRSGD